MCKTLIESLATRAGLPVNVEWGMTDMAFDGPVRALPPRDRPGACVQLVIIVAALASAGASGPALGAPPKAQSPQSAHDLLPAPAGVPVAGGYGVAARGEGDYAT